MSKSVITFVPILMAVALVVALTKPAAAYKPDLEKCKFVKTCETITPPCHKPHPQTHPCPGPYTKCTTVKQCPND